MQERKLATIQKIENLTPILDADKIELAQVLGWEVVVRKDEFKIGELCVYVQIDSLLPDKPEFEFMKERKFRVRTIKLRKQISQGIVFPLSIIPEGFLNKKNNLKTDTDVTDILEIKKWEPYQKKIRKYQKEYEDLTLIEKIKEKIFRIKVRRKKLKSAFPKHLVPKTTETRIQNSPSILKRHTNDLVNVTEKIDGTSATFLFDKKKFVVCSRNMIRKKRDEGKDFPYWEIVEKYDIKNKLLLIGKEYAIQGEIFGRNVENGTGIDYGFKDRCLSLFNIYDMKAKKYVNEFEFKKLCDKMKLPMVPFLGVMELPRSINEINTIAHGNSKLNKNYLREGIVVRSRTISNDRWDFSFKYVDPEFQLKYEEKNRNKK